MWGLVVVLVAATLPPCPGAGPSPAAPVQCDVAACEKSLPVEQSCQTLQAYVTCLRSSAACPGTAPIVVAWSRVTAMTCGVSSRPRAPALRPVAGSVPADRPAPGPAPRPDRASCTEVVFLVDDYALSQYTGRGDARDRDYVPISAAHARAQVEMTNMLRPASTAEKTCFAYFHLPAEPLKSPDGKLLHNVWGKVAASAMLWDKFPSAQYALFLDCDAVMSTPQTVRGLWELLAKGDSKLADQPGLVMTMATGAKRTTFGGAWLDYAQCTPAGIKGYCINSAAFLLKRGPDCDAVLRAWWNSSTDGTAENVVRIHPKTGANLGKMHGGAFTGQIRGHYFTEDQQSEQNRINDMLHRRPDLRALVRMNPCGDEVAACHAPATELYCELKGINSCADRSSVHKPCLHDAMSKSAGWYHADEPNDAYSAQVIAEDRRGCFIQHLTDLKGHKASYYNVTVASDLRLSVLGCSTHRMVGHSAGWGNDTPKSLAARRVCSDLRNRFVGDIVGGHTDPLAGNSKAPANSVTELSTEQHLAVSAAKVDTILRLIAEIDVIEMTQAEADGVPAPRPPGSQ